MIIIITICLITLVFLLLFLNWRHVLQILRQHVKGFNLVILAWLLLFIGILNMGKFESENIVVSNSFQLLMIATVGVIILLSFFARLKALSYMNIAIACLFVYGISGVLSVFYSPFPTLSLYKAALIILSLLICLLVLSLKPQPRYIYKFYNITIFFYFLLLVSFVAGMLISPDNALINKPGMLFGMLRGWLIITNPNAVGFIAGILSLVYLNHAMKQKVLNCKMLYISLFMLSFFILILAQSRACVVGFVCSLLVILMARRKFVLLIALLFFGVSLLTIQDLNPYKTTAVQYYERGQTEKQFESWSGRKDAWGYAWYKFKESPLLGFGMAAGVRFGAIGQGMQGSHLHSSYFEVLVNSGLFGFIPWILSLIIVTLTILKRLYLKPRWFSDKYIHTHIEISALLVFCLVRSIAGTTFVLFDFTFMLYITFIVYANYLSQSATKGRKHAI